MKRSVASPENVKSSMSESGRAMSYAAPLNEKPMRKMPGAAIASVGRFVSANTTIAMRIDSRIDAPNATARGSQNSGPQMRARNELTVANSGMYASGM